MSSRGRKRHHDNHRNRQGDRHSREEGTESKMEVDESSPVYVMFKDYQQQLDRRYDKHERLVKLSRDVTIESKKIIFLLHRCTGGKREEIFSTADQKLKDLKNYKWRAIAKELEGEDPYQFLRAYSPGLQEYIEAISFYHYLKTDQLISLEDCQKDLEVSEPIEPKVPEEAGEEKEGEAGSEDVSAESSIGQVANMSLDSRCRTLQVHIPPVEYVLGIADLTGELMRLAIGSVGAGDLELPFKLCSFMRNIHDAFVTLGNICRELPRKLTVLKQSMQKVETACYTVQVRGSEFPKHLLANILSARSVDVPMFPEEEGQLMDD